MKRCESCRKLIIKKNKQKPKVCKQCYIEEMQEIDDRILSYAL